MNTKLLKQKILDLAIRGKLVPQDPNDEPASILLDHIREEKEKLIAQGKIKRSKKNSDNRHYENMPFEIPERWEWCKVKDISSSILYGVSEAAKTEGKYKLLRITDIQNNTVDWNNVPYTDYNSTDANKYLLEEDDILFARTGATVGKSYLVKGLSRPSIYASYLIRVKVSREILPQYIKFFFESGYYWEQISDSSVGTGQPNVNGTLLGDLNIPIPPLKEQHIIVSEISGIFAVIDEIEADKSVLHVTIKQTKSKILELALQGKLVEQDCNDEPAVDLLRRVNPNYAPSDNPHYPNLPNGWCVVKIGDIYNHTTGKALKKSNTNGVLREYLTTSNVYWNTFDFSEIRSMYFTETELEKCTVHKDDLLICNGGDVGRAAVWNYDYDVCIQNHVSRLRPKCCGVIDNVFCSYIFMYLKRRGLLNGKGVAITSLSAIDLLSIPIPLPPYKEQKRIVQAIQIIQDNLNEITEGL